MTHKKRKIPTDRGFSCIGLDNPKSTINIGSVLRACGNYNTALLAVTGTRAADHLGRIPIDTHKIVRHVPVLRVDDLQLVIPYNCIPVAVDLVQGATSLINYRHPQRAFYVFGAEDATLGRRVLSWCKDVIYIPTTGCMNLAATVNVVLYDRMNKRWKET